ncbi:hypothetical protein FRB90_002478 [Tulasnella sp. 427]|nr:hypothetical protein FRB90_002478 [Tulasnella sp. 427]
MDDFKDLVWTSPTTSTPSNSNSKPSSAYDPFSLLAGSSSNTSTNRGTPNYLSSAGSGPPSRTLTPSNPNPNLNAAGKPSSSSDAFSGLLNFGGGGGNGGSNLSMAERQAQADRKRREEDARRAQEAKAHGAFWDRFESGGGVGGSTTSERSLPVKTSANGPSIVLPSSAPKPAAPSSLGGILQPTSRPISPAVKPTASPKPPAATKGKSLTVWDFDLLGASPTTASASTTTTAQPTASQNASDGLLDEFDVFAQPTKPAGATTSAAAAPKRSESPGDFDWGDREDREERNGAREYSGDEDDVLGLLSQPVGKVKAPKVVESTASTSTTNGRINSTSPRPNASSPPPHVLGKLVEMGFSIQQARVALAATETGADVEAAMEILLTQAAVKEADEREEVGQRPGRDEDPDEERRRRQQARRQGPSRANVPPARRAASGNEEGPAEGDSPAALGQLADHADKVLAQASEIGANLFGKANALWKSANKAYEDRVKSASPAAGGSSGGGGGGGGRPKWMTDAAVDEPEPATRKPRKQSSFRDDVHREEDVGLPPRPKASTGSRRTEEPARSAAVPTGSLFASAPEAPKSYVSPHRRKAQQQPTPTPPAQQTPPPAPKKPAREYITCSSSTLSSSASHRTAGTAAYKLGQFANAEQSFTRAIEVLPSGHMGLVPLWNNRAMSRLKTGDGAGCVSDCTAVLELVGAEWKVGDEPADAGGANGAGVELGEALVKATTRRAQGYEMNEKWEKAKEDWEKLAGIGNAWGSAGVKAKAEAFRGLDRCRKALAPPPPASAPSASTPKPKPRPVAASSGPSEAALRLQAANQKAEADEAERYRLKDSVESRLASWKGGKENNIRALIASLENVLWPELNWVKVGMHELITEQQVKIRYMKAIAKVHPDKLRNATVEHQMIANGVFGALNDAYNVFKPA